VKRNFFFLLFLPINKASKELQELQTKAAQKEQDSIFELMILNMN
jgi:hypothetical protein